MTEEDKSKDRFFERLGELAEEMIAAHGKDFATGTSAARWMPPCAAICSATWSRAGSSG
jgi:hypothetical protein